MANTRQASFRLGEETERQLDALAGITGSSRTEVVRSLISNRYTESHSIKEELKSGESDSAQMLLDDIFSHEVVGYE